MTDYISREAAIEAITTAEPINNGGIKYNRYPPSHDEVLKRINSLPAADVRENKRGHWNVYSAKHGLYSCSECHSVPAFLHSPFCPNCGADMREEQT